MLPHMCLSDTRLRFYWTSIAFVVDSRHNVTWGGGVRIKRPQLVKFQHDKRLYFSCFSTLIPFNLLWFDANILLKTLLSFLHCFLNVINLQTWSHVAGNVYKVWQKRNETLAATVRNGLQLASHESHEGFQMAQMFQEWSWSSGRWPKARTTFHMQRLTIDCQDACVWVGNEQGDNQNHLDWQPWDVESVHKNGTKTAEWWPREASNECLQKHLGDNWWEARVSWQGRYWRWSMGFSIRTRDKEAKSPMEVSRITKTKEDQNVQIQDQSDAHHIFWPKWTGPSQVCAGRMSSQLGATQ